MSEIQELIEALIQGQEIHLVGVLVLTAALVAGGILSGYIKEIWFYFFPFPNQKSRILALQRVVIDEATRADKSRLFAETTVLKANEYEWEIVVLKRDMSARDSRLRQRETKIMSLKATIRALQSKSTTS